MFKLSKIYIHAFLLFCFVGVFTFNVNILKFKSISLAEQSGSSPDSGVASSVLKTTYDFLVSKGTNYGSSQPSDWTNDWGTYWNRIMYSAYWAPEGTATENDIYPSETFYSGNNDRTIKTGSASVLDYSFQSLAYQQDQLSGDYTGEESTWTQTNSAAGQTVWYDTKTGLYWARSQPTDLTNVFPNSDHSTCDFFSTTPRGDYSGGDTDCGNAINACGNLSLATHTGQVAKTDWYLPSQKEMHQAYIDGIYNKTGSTFPLGSKSSTEVYNNSSMAYIVGMGNGYTIGQLKTTADAVQCVRRD